MSEQIDLRTAADGLAAVVMAIADDQLGTPTPCDGLSVGDLLHHVEGLSLAFAWAARKESHLAGDDPAPTADAAKLDPDWRTLIPARLSDLADAWADPGAWSGQTSVGGVEQTGPECAATGADELVVHAWDLAVATGQDFAPDDDAVALALTFVEPISGAMPDGVPGLFTAPRPVPVDATPFERLLLLTGRQPQSVSQRTAR